jgi:hypothetical protein
VPSQAWPDRAAARRDAGLPGVAGDESPDAERALLNVAALALTELVLLRQRRWIPADDRDRAPTQDY